MASSADSKLDVLHEICEMDEMKRDTSVTKSILTATRYILSTQNEEFTRLIIDKLNDSFEGMLKSVNRYKFTTKREKLWMMFHKFSLNEGKKLCEEYQINHCIPEVNEFFWQLVMKGNLFILLLINYQLQLIAVQSTQLYLV